MARAFLLVILFSLILVSGCTTETGKTVETTKLTIPQALPQESSVRENIDELHKEFEEFEKSQLQAHLPPAQQKNKTEEKPGTENQTDAPEEPAAPEAAQEEQTPNRTIECPPCEDSNPCTEDRCSEQTGFECRHDPLAPCCGNGECESGEDWSSCQEDCTEPECVLHCGPCETPDNQTCSCLPRAECSPGDGCCPTGCVYPEDSDCPRPSVIFSEIFYNPKDSDEGHEWIEIFNNGTVAVDITKWRFLEEETNHLINNISAETELKPQAYAVIAQNSAQFILDYPDFVGMLFDSSFSLKNTGETLVLKTGKAGEIADSVLYNSTWGGNGNSFSLEKIDLNGPAAEGNWNQSLTEKGTPGQRNSMI